MFERVYKNALKHQIKLSNVLNQDTSVGFDRIAFLYDSIARIASFNGINKSQLAFLSHLTEKSTCLILGGGTGHFLQKLVAQNKLIKVTYVEASSKMIALAQKRIRKNNAEALDRITFICMHAEYFKFENYDSIVCNYFLDLFDEMDVHVWIKKFKTHLKKDGLLYITDFSMPAAKGFIQWSTKVGLKILYLLFRWTTSLSNTRLPDIESIVMAHRFVPLHTAGFFKGILRCNLYRK